MRVLIYSHDTYGLGHFRRSLVIAEALAAADAATDVLIVTGSSRASSFRLPPRCSTAILPSVLKQADGSYLSRDLPLSLVEIIKIRTQKLCNCLQDFKPDAILIDHSPLGVENELEPFIQLARNQVKRPVLILGMRDVVDSVENVRSQWQGSGALRAIETDYDRVLVYGSKDILGTAQELGIDQLRDGEGRRKTSFVGYVARDTHRRAPSSDRILVMAGGGGDGHFLMRKFIGLLESHSVTGLHFDVVAGPFLSEKRLSDLKNRIDGLDQDVELIRFDNELENRIATSKGVISMAGYNSFVEIINAGRPALFVPRENPRLEQLVRTERLAPMCGFHWCRAGDLQDSVFLSFFQALEQPFVQSFDRGLLKGGAHAAREILNCRAQAVKSEDQLKERAR